jgi:serine phosphatase RsbU (regulator of sigma subunit)
MGSAMSEWTEPVQGEIEEVSHGHSRVGHTEPERQLAVARAALQHADLTLDELWLRYFALGGTAGQLVLEAYLENLMPLAAIERDILAIAVNERLDEISWPHRVPYAHSVGEPLPTSGPFTAVIDLLESARNSPSEHLPRVAARAGGALGVDISVYVVDDDQRLLIPVPTRIDNQSAEPPPLLIDTTLAGHAFRQVTTMVSDTDGTRRLWVPLLDDMERLGVLDVVIGPTQELHDPALRQQCEWLASLLAHLVTLGARYGDRLDAHRRAQPRTAAADLIWTLVPPTTAAVPGISLAAAIEPSHQAGGDVYDYALSADTAQLALFDAMGHNFNAALIAATALAASRAARRKGWSLTDQARSVDDLIAENFDSATFATGILASLDLSTGLLRYVCAGHPHPLVLRHGKVVKHLRGGRRVPFGLGTTAATIAEEHLEPGDHLILHTDGITEARDLTGAFFGDHRLTDFLEREAATGNPAPETVRRLIHALLDHHHGQLADDATILVVHWQPGTKLPGIEAG